jgi:hypothetical protein
MTERTTHPARENVLLATVAVMFGALAAAGYGAWRAISRDGGAASERWSEFGEAMLFPGALIIAGVAAMVWLGWKANIDD